MKEEDKKEWLQNEIEKEKYNKQLDYMKKIADEDKEKIKEIKERNPYYRERYDEKLTVSGYHITHTIYDRPIKKGFKRNVMSVVDGAEKRKKSLEIREQLNQDLERFVEQFPKASKSDKKAMAALNKIKKKYKDELEIRNDNQLRKINKLKAKIQANFDEWTHFITLSFRDNLVGTVGIAKAKEYFKDWLDRMRNLYSDFIYVYVIEFQERAGVHFHVVCRFDKGEMVPKTRFKEIRKTWEHLGGINIQGIRMKYDREVGNKIKNQTKEELALKLRELTKDEKLVIIWSIGSYLTSYLKKGADDVLLFGSKTYGSSKDLKEEIILTDKKKIAHFLKYLGVEQLNKNEYQVKQKAFIDGEEVETDDKITMKYYNKLIPKDVDKK